MKDLEAFERYEERQRECRWAITDRRKALGICVNCGHEKAVPGKTCCEKCLERSRRKHAEQRAERISKGICVYCGKAKARDGKKTCAACGEFLSSNALAYYRRKREAGGD